MKSTIASDFRSWLHADDDPNLTKAKYVIVGIYGFVAYLWVGLFISAVLLGNWSGANYAAFEVAQIAGVGAGFLWAWKALDRWRDRAIARIRAEEANRP